MTEQEQADLDALKQAIQKRKLDEFEHLKMYNDLDSKGLEHSGHRGKTNAEVMQWSFKRALADIEAMIRKHERKYPD